MDLNPVEALQAAQISAMAEHPQMKRTAAATIGAARLAELVKFTTVDYDEEYGEVGPKDTDGDDTMFSVRELQAIVGATENFREEIAHLDHEIAGEMLDMVQEVIDEVDELTDDEGYGYADPEIKKTMTALKARLVAARAALVSARIDGLAQLADTIKPKAPKAAGLEAPAPSGVSLRP